MVKTYSIFDEFYDVVHSFGLKQRQTDIGTPPFRYQSERSTKKYLLGTFVFKSIFYGFDHEERILRFISFGHYTQD
jgi:hypothetical protein